MDITLELHTNAAKLTLIRLFAPKFTFLAQCTSHLSLPLPMQFLSFLPSPFFFSFRNLIHITVCILRHLIFVLDLLCFIPLVLSPYISLFCYIFCFILIVSSIHYISGKCICSIYNIKLFYIMCHILLLLFVLNTR